MSSVLHVAPTQKRMRILQLRDLALKHLPKAVAQAEVGKNVWGPHMTDLAHTSVAFDVSADPAASAVERQAAALLHATYWHPETYARYGVDYKPDVEGLAEARRNVSAIEPYLIEQARLLLDLTGETPPIWFKVAPAVSSAPALARTLGEQQEEAILAEFQNLGINPLRFPQGSRGKPGTKSAVRQRIVIPSRLFRSSKVFESAWERLSQSGRIKSA